EQSIVDPQRTRLVCTFGSEVEYLVGAVGVGIDEVSDRAQVALRPSVSVIVAADREACQGESRDVLMTRSQLSPGDISVAVGIEPDCKVKTAQRYVPSSADRAPGDVDCQVAVARLMGLRHGGGHKHDSQEQRADHGTGTPQGLAPVSSQSI